VDSRQTDHWRKCLLSVAGFLKKCEKNVVETPVKLLQKNPA
jgi:hypothetical protein